MMASQHRDAALCLRLFVFAALVAYVGCTKTTTTTTTTKPIPTTAPPTLSGVAAEVASLNQILTTIANTRLFVSGNVPISLGVNTPTLISYAAPKFPFYDPSGMLRPNNVTIKTQGRYSVDVRVEFDPVNNSSTVCGFAVVVWAQTSPEGNSYFQQGSNQLAFIYFSQDWSVYSSVNVAAVGQSMTMYLEAGWAIEAEVQVDCATWPTGGITLKTFLLSVNMQTP